MSRHFTNGPSHALVITTRPRSSWPLVLAGLVLVIIARRAGI